MSAPLVMKITGEATIPKIAERAIIDLEVGASDPSHEKASSKVTDTAKEIQRLLKQYSTTASSTPEEQAAAAIPKWSMGKMKTSSFVLHPDTKHYYNDMGDFVVSKPTKIHTANVKFNIRVREFGKLGMLAHTFSQMKHVKIERTHWIITAQTRKAYRSELRKMAAADALQRAKDYAETFGLSNVRASKLVEQSYKDGAWNPYMPRASMIAAQQMQMQIQAQQMQQMQQPQRASTSGGDDEGVDLFFEPDEIHLSMSIDCEFIAE